MQDEYEKDGEKEMVDKDAGDESKWPTKVDSELDTASVQFQSQGVRWLLGGGGHKKAVRPLWHEAKRHILRLCVQGHGHDDLQVHAAVITQNGGL